MTSPTSTAVRPLDRVLLVCNPTAGARDGAAEIRELKRLLDDRGLVVEVVTNLELLPSLTASLSATGRMRAIVACGGDGTVAEVVNRAAQGTPVTVYPMGTANLLAGYLGIPRSPAAMARMVADEGVIATLDAGCANGRIFLLMVGCGFDADVVRRLHQRRRGGHITYFTWAQPILAAIRSYTYPSLEVTCVPRRGDEERGQHAHWAFAVNLPVYAGGLNVAPNARADDGLLDVCTFHGGSLWHGIKYVSHVLLRRHQRLASYQCESAQRVRIEATEPVPYQLDGDPGGMLPLEIESLPSRLTLLMPPAAARKHQLAASVQGPLGVLPR